MLYDKRWKRKRRRRRNRREYETKQNMEHNMIEKGVVQWFTIVVVYGTDSKWMSMAIRCKRCILVSIVLWDHTFWAPHHPKSLCMMCRHWWRFHSICASPSFDRCRCWTYSHTTVRAKVYWPLVPIMMKTSSSLQITLERVAPGPIVCLCVCVFVCLCLFNLIIILIIIIDHNWLHFYYYYYVLSCLINLIHNFFFLSLSFSYMLVGCSALSLILKTFSTMIKNNISAPPGIGVDITREERFVTFTYNNDNLNLN